MTNRRTDRQTDKQTVSNSAVCRPTLEIFYFWSARPLIAVGRSAVVTHHDEACLMWSLQTKEEFNNEMQSLTSKHNQDIEEVKELVDGLQVSCCAFADFSLLLDNT